MNDTDDDDVIVILFFPVFRNQTDPPVFMQQLCSRNTFQLRRHPGVKVLWYFCGCVFYVF